MKSYLTIIKRLFEDIYEDEDVDDIETEDTGYGSLNSEFNKIFKLTPESLKYADNLEEAIFDAKNGNDDAELYLLNKSKNMIFSVFWKNFIGKEASKRVMKLRISNGAFHDFVSLIYIAFEKAVKAFDPKKYSKIKIGNFQYYLGRYLKAEAISYNIKKSSDPLDSAISPDGMDSENKEEGNRSAWDSFVGGKEDEYERDFIDSWKDFCNDPRMNDYLSKKVKKPLRQVLKTVLSGKYSIPQIAEKLGITKASLYNAIDIGDILKDYNIDQSELSKYLRSDPDLLLKYL